MKLLGYNPRYVLVYFCLAMEDRTLSNPITGEKVKLITSAQETAGACTIATCYLLPGGSKGLHYHKVVTQVFTALKGRLHLYQGGKKIIELRPGEQHKILPGVVHGLFNPTNEIVQYQLTITPGHEGLENMIRILYGLAYEKKLNASGIPQDIHTQALLMKMGDTYFMDAVTHFQPLINWKAKQAKKRGIEEALFSSYCSHR